MMPTSRTVHCVLNRKETGWFEEIFAFKKQSSFPIIRFEKQSLSGSFAIKRLFSLPLTFFIECMINLVARLSWKKHRTHF